MPSLSLNNIIAALTTIIIFTNYSEAQIADTLITDSLAVMDSLVSTEGKNKRFDVDAVIYANSSDSLTFSINEKKMFLFGKGELKYKQTDLTSDRIYIDFNDNSLDAFAKIDSSDSAKTQLVDFPILSEDGEVYEGSSLQYNFKTKRGFISMAKNKETEKRYEGDKVKKVDNNTYFIEDGLYTTCENDTPHTYFTASKMKVIQKDKIIARWIFMHVGGVPFPIPLPFAVFPNKTGRRSGMIIPSYGSTADRGEYFRNFGYFLALSDYYDLTLTGDYYTQGGYGLRGRGRYKKRYEFNGNINGGISRVTLGEKEDPTHSDRFSWNLNVYHHHDITPTMKFDANLQFLSSKYLEDNSRRLNDLLKQDIVSNATLVKRWEESGNSITINYNRNQNLQTGSTVETLPSLNFNMSQKYPFKKEGSTRKNQEWYEYIGFTYNNQFKNELKKTRLNSDEDFVRDDRLGAQHNLNLNASPRLGFFNITPAISYSEKWYDKKLKREYVFDYEDSTGVHYERVEKMKKDFGFVRTFDFRLSASTKIYGMAQPQILGISAFRHTVSPSISYSFRPDFSKPFWGYYEEIFNPSTGLTESYDKYGRGIFGGASSGESQSINLSIGNIFEIKTMKDPTDTTSAEQKIQLLNLDLSTGYNFAADSLRLQDLRITYRTQIGNLFSFNGSSSYSFYDYFEVGEGQTLSSRDYDKFLISAGKGLLRLKNFNINISATLAGSKSSSDTKRVGKQNAEDDENIENQRSDYIELFEESKPDFSIPWNLSLNYNYNYNKNNVFNPLESSNIGLNLSLSLTEAWRVTFRSNYDFIEEKFNAPQITVYRDLHCWEMNFIWNPIGLYRGFRLEIRIKAPELQDIKVTKTKDIFSGF